MVRRVLVVGASGYVGSALAAGLRYDFEVFGTYNRHPVHIPGMYSFKLNLFDGAEILDLLKKLKPDAILYCAGLTKPEDCKQHKQRSDILNYQSPNVFLKSGIGKMFIYLSSHLLFSGNPKIVGEPPYDEDADVDPVSEFAQVKFKMENATLIYKGRGVVVRLGPVYGEPCNLYHFKPDEWGENRSWLRNIYGSLDKGMPLKLPNDQIVSPVYLGDVVRGIKHIFRKNPTEAELFHFGASEGISFYDIGQQIVGAFGFSDKLISEISLFDQNEDLRGAVVLNTTLDVSKFEERYGYKFLNFNEGLAEYTKRLHDGQTDEWVT